MKINLFKMIKENNFNCDERIIDIRKNIQTKMLLLIKIAFAITITIDAISGNKYILKCPILFYTLLLEISIEPLICCLKGAFFNSKEAIFNIIIGCWIIGLLASQIFDKYFSIHIWWLSYIIEIVAMVFMYIIYVGAFRIYLKKVDTDE